MNSSLDIQNDKTSPSPDCSKTSPFKKPVLIGKVGKVPRKTIQNNTPTQESVPEVIKHEETNTINTNSEAKEIQEKSDATVKANDKVSESLASTKQSSEQDIPLPYAEPSWSGLPESETDYSFEVLKNGVIIEKINLMKKPYWVFGRLSSCDVTMAHPTISRYHAVLQYKAVPSAEHEAGFYIYDLNSTHGTFLNKNRVKPKMYVRVQVGHMLRLGCSTRTFLLTGPEQDTESETELSVTELKLQRAEELRQRHEEQQRIEQEREAQKKKEEEKGIDWGLGEDADEETDVCENPFAETGNEQAYMGDPKRALRGYMEREGAELVYEVEERGAGQFVCRVLLPVQDARGRALTAHALVTGKKKEAVLQCAIDACRILDRHGLLTQPTHESRKRKAKNWEENDYYDSDEDTFLDRTGTIERKREKRMRAKQQQQPETYQSLVAKEEKLSQEIQSIEKQLSVTSKATSSRTSSDSDEVDPLDSFMSDLNTNKPDKYTCSKLKAELIRLRKEHAETVKLVNVARPAHLPPLVTQSSSSSAVASTSGSKTTQVKLPMYGKRLKVKVMLPSRDVPTPMEETSTTNDNNDEEVEEEVEEDEDREVDQEEDQQEDNTTNEQEEQSQQTEERTAETEQDEEEAAEPNVSRKGIIKQLKVKMSMCDQKALASLDSRVKAKISKTVTKLRKIAEEEERIVVDEKRLAVQKRKIFEQVNQADSQDIEKQIKLSNALNRMTGEFCVIGDRKMKIVEKINTLADDINNIAVEIRAASQVQHEKAVNRMKEFVEKAYKQQTEIFVELENLENSVTDQKVVDKLKELYEWLSGQKVKMLENLEKLKNVKLSENTKLLEDIIEFEEKSNNFITTILEEIRKIRKLSKEKKTAKKQENNKQDSENDGKDTESASCSRLNDDENEDSVSADAEKKKKKNQRRVMQRQGRAEAEKMKQYEEDAKKEDYNMWVPPDNQTGDGRTALNDKFGY